MEYQHHQFQELVMVPARLVKLISCLTMPVGHFTRQAMLMLSSFGSIQNPPEPCLEASV